MYQIRTETELHVAAIFFFLKKSMLWLVNTISLPDCRLCSVKSNEAVFKICFMSKVAHIRHIEENKGIYRNAYPAIPEKLPSMVSVLSPPSNTSSESQFCSVTKLITWI